MSVLVIIGVTLWPRWHLIVGMSNRRHSEWHLGIVLLSADCVRSGQITIRLATASCRVTRLSYLTRATLRLAIECNLEWDVSITVCLAFRTTFRRLDLSLFEHIDHEQRRHNVRNVARVSFTLPSTLTLTITTLTFSLIEPITETLFHLCIPTLLLVVVVIVVFVIVVVVIIAVVSVAVAVVCTV